jgi:Protein of unknown function (DUF998)
VRSWIVYLGLMIFGIIFLLLGLAEPPSEPVVRLGLILGGGLFAAVGTLCLATRKRGEVIPPFEANDRRRELHLGILITLFAAIGAICVAVAYPFDTAESQGAAWWSRWVLFAGMIWFLSAGVFMILHARR